MVVTLFKKTTLTVGWKRGTNSSLACKSLMFCWLCRSVMMSHKHMYGFGALAEMTDSVIVFRRTVPSFWECGKVQTITDFFPLNFAFLLYCCCLYHTSCSSVCLAGWVGLCLEYYYGSKPSTPSLGTLSQSTTLLWVWHCWLPHAKSGYLFYTVSPFLSLPRLAGHIIKLIWNNLHALWALVFPVPRCNIHLNKINTTEKPFNP